MTLRGQTVNPQALERFFTYAVDLLCIADLEGYLRMVNPSWQQLLGWTPEEMGARPYIEFVHPDDVQITLNAAEALGRGEPVIRFVNRFRSRSGRYHHLEWCSILEPNERLIYATARDITDTLRQASHLAEVEALTGVGSWELDLDVGEVLWSKVTHQIHETDPKVFNNQLTDALLFFPPEGRRVLEPALAALMERGTPYDLELPFITATGRHRWVRATSQAEVRDGRVIRTFGTFQDITDTRNATEELRLREERLRLATQAGGVGILDWELTTQKITADTQTLALIGGTGAPKGPKTLDVAAVLRAIHPDDRPRVTAELTTAMAHDDDSFDTQFRYLRADNQWIWLHARGKVLRRSAGGAAARALGTIVDITASQSQQEALVTAKNRLQATMSAIPDILFEIDASDRFVTYHTASPSQLAQPPERFLGRHYRDTLPPEIADTVQQAMYEAAELGRSSPHRYAIILPQGPRWYEVTAARRLPSVRGDPLSFVFLTRDITDRHNTERALEVARQEAEAASAAKSQFLATMSHEIRTPLHGMLGMLGALERGIDGPAARRQLTILRESAEMLMEILNDILDLSKIEAGKLTLEIIPFLPSALVRRVQALHQARAQERGLEFTVYTSPCSDSWRLGDPHRILQILHNLVGNAIKFTARGAVQVAIECEEGTPLYLTVRDTGIGMNPEQQANVFAAFEQADSSITRSYGGTGLGMSIVHRLVRAMDGTLALESSLDRGTTVSITLPLPHTPAPPQNQTPRRDDNPLPTRAELALRGLRILAVDDNPINRLVLQGLLDHLGVEAVLDESGPAAVGRVDREAFDLYLLDISMPELDGVETLCRIRAVEAGLQRRPAPAIAVTAHTYPAEIDRYLAAGFAAHLAKPILRDSLLCALTNALSLTGPATPAT